MRLLTLIYLFGLFTLTSCNKSVKSEPDATIKNSLRAPAYPLVTIDPNTSAWSMTDNLYDDQVKHWTGKEFPLLGAIRVDGQLFRFMGIEKIPMKALAGMSTDSPWTGKYVNTAPSVGWETPTFDDKTWKTGEAAFGTSDETNVKTLWNTEDIWVRRNIKLDPNEISNKKLYLKYSHDDIFELYINGIQIVKTGYEWKKDVVLPLSEDVITSIENGNILIAAHCNNKVGGGLVDFGIYTDSEVKELFTTMAIQKSADVQATQTHYEFVCGNVGLKLTFMAPLLMNDLNLISRPVNYISYQVTSLDDKKHDIQIYFEAAPNWALDNPAQANKGEGYEKDNMLYLKSGSTEQNILAKKGDDLRIDWGYFYLCSDKTDASLAVGNPLDMRNTFIQNGKLSGNITSKENASLAIAKSLGNTETASGNIMIGYDDIYSIQYFGENLRPYWNAQGDKTIEQAFASAANDYESLTKKCNDFDYDLMTKATESGGKEYAELCALAYRQSISAHKLVLAPNGDLLFLSKENNSNGSIGTVDITYPSAPLFLYYNPELVKGLLNFIFYYSESGKWTKPFPAHDIGTYPIANGQTYGGDMPIEEAGNVLALVGALAKIEGNAEYAKKHWDILTLWTNYLVEKGLDPENQLCTDDFAGHFAHNTNLSIKAIMGIASYGYLANELGKVDISEKYLAKAREMAVEWEKMANDGDHYRLTFDKPNTWSQKYNIIWDKLFKYKIFPTTIIEKEIPYYLKKQNEYGLPLDSRENYTKSDWIIWTATLAKDDDTFKKFITPLHKFMNETTDRVPMSDFYNTDSKTHVNFKARAVVGGYYMKMLDTKLNK